MPRTLVPARFHEAVHDMQTTAVHASALADIRVHIRLSHPVPQPRATAEWQPLLDPSVISAKAQPHSACQEV